MTLAFPQPDLRRAALWLPVFLGAGAAAYLLWPSEPAGLWILSALILGLFALWRALRHGGLWRIILSGAGCAFALGFAAAAWRAHDVAAPVLQAETSAIASGRIIALDRSRSGAARALLDCVSVEGLADDKTPRHLRITLFRAPANLSLGDGLEVKARLSPPAPPSAPGDFDFRRYAWFKQIGGLGYARAAPRLLPGGPVCEGKAALGAWRLRLARSRARIASALMARMSHDAGALASALAVGLRGDISAQDHEALRLSSLAHLLAISGLHMGLLTGLVFGGLRLALALPPFFGARWPIKKIAAVGAILAGAAYLALSGAGVATQRAFIMALVMLVGVLLDRPAITLRALAIAACIILLRRPEEILAPGFQMSFAAATALVSVYGWSAPFWRDERARSGFARRLALYGAGILLTSLVAGLATAPFSAYHFNRITPYGLPANILAAPVMALCVMPMLVISALLAPFGLAAAPLALMELGIEAILAIARAVAAMKNADAPVFSAPPIALAFLSLGGLWLCLIRGKAAMAGLAPILIGAAIWAWAPRADILIAPKAQIIGLRGDDGFLRLTRPKAAGFIAERWLKRDGDPRDQIAAHEKRYWRCLKRLCLGPLRPDGRNGGPVLALLLSSDAGLAARLCHAHAVVAAPSVSRAQLSQSDTSQCLFLDASDLRAAQSLTLDHRGDVIKRRQTGGGRLWSPQ